MGCVVSQKRVGAINFIQTPRSKAFLDKNDNLTFKYNEKDHQNSNRDQNESKDSGSNENQYKEQVFIMKMESISSSKRKISGEHKFVVRRASSIVGIKEASFNEFSFKNSMDSFHEKDKDSCGDPSFRQNFENSPASVSSGTYRMRSVDSTNNILGACGLKRTSTPSFVNRPSGFFLERNNSVRSLTSKPMHPNHFHRLHPHSSGTLVVHDFRSDRTSFDLPSPGLDPSIEVGSLHEADLKGHDLKVSTLHPLYGIRDVGREDQKQDEAKGKSSQILTQSSRVSLEGQNSEKKANLSTMAGSELGNGEQEKVSTQLMKEKIAQKIQEANENIDYKKQPSNEINRMSPQGKLANRNDFSTVSNQVTALEPQMIQFAENSKFNRSSSNIKTTADTQTKFHGGSTPVRGLPLQKIELDSFSAAQETENGSSKISDGKVQPVEPTSAKRSGRSYSAAKIYFDPQEELRAENLSSQIQPSNQSSLKNCFSSSTKLSIKEKFKRNLLEVVKNEEDDISPILSPQKPMNKPLKPMPPQEFGKIGRPELQASIRKHSIDEMIEKTKNEMSKERHSIPGDSSPGSKELGMLTQEINKSRSESLPVKDVPKKTTTQRNKNLLNLAREGNDDSETQVQIPLHKLDKTHSVESTRPSSIRIPLHKFEKTGSADNTAITGLSPSPIGRIDLSTRNNNLDFDSVQTPLGNTPLAQYNNIIGSHHFNQSMISATPSRLNETYNRSIINFEDNVSVANITNYVFTYENEEIEYDEKATNRSRLYSQDQSILTGMSSPVRSQSLSPINGLMKHKLSEDKRESLWQGRQNLLAMSPARRSGSPSNVGAANGMQNKRESFTSLSTIRGGQHPDTTDFNQSMFAQDKSMANLNRQSSEALLWEEKDSSGLSPNTRKHLSLPDHNKFKPFRISKFHQESEGNVEMGHSDYYNNEPKQDIQNTLATPVTRPNPKFIQRSKSSGLGPMPETIQEFSPDLKSESAGLSRNSSPHVDLGQQAGGQNHLLVPPLDNDPSKNRKKPFTRHSSEAQQGSKSPILKGAVLKRTLTGVVETNKLDKTRDDEGQKKINQYLFIKDLGKGGFGKVKLAQDTANHKYFAVKIANKAKLQRKLISKSKDALVTLESEIAIMKKLNHQNIVKLWEVIDDPKEEKLYLFMDLVKKGAVMSKTYWKYENKQALDRSAFSAMDNSDISIISEIPLGKRVLTEEKALKYFRGLVLGLDYLHNYVGVIHRDIKPENLLIDEFDCLKVSDFGVSSIMEQNSDELKNNAGTKLFLPPESFEGKSYKGKPADIWAAGATLYYFMTGKPPFNAMDQYDLMNKVMKEEPEYPEHINKKIVDVIKGCLKKEPETRMTLAEIMSSPWVTEDGTYTVKNVFEDDEEFKTSDQDVHSALTKLKIRVAVRIKMKKRLDQTRDKILERRKSGLDTSLILNEQQKSKRLLQADKEANAEDEERKRSQTEEKKDQAVRNSTKQHRMNLLKAV